jgi:hypothetical protein
MMAVTFGVTTEAIRRGPIGRVSPIEVGSRLSLPTQGDSYDAAGFLIVRTDHSLAVQDDFVVALRRSDLSLRRPPATGLLGHYPDRTFTGKSTKAFRTHAAPESVARAAAFAQSIGARPAWPLTGVLYDAAEVHVSITACWFAAPRFDAPDLAGRRRVGYRAPLAACPGGTHTHWLIDPSHGHTYFSNFGSVPLHPATSQVSLHLESCSA